jgi:hypothetical protein
VAPTSSRPIVKGTSLVGAGVSYSFFVIHIIPPTQISFDTIFRMEQPVERPRRLGKLDIAECELPSIVLASFSCIAWEEDWIRLLNNHYCEGLKALLYLLRTAYPQNQTLLKRFTCRVPELNNSLHWPNLQQCLNAIDTGTHAGSKAAEPRLFRLRVGTDNRRLDSKISKLLVTSDAVVCGSGDLRNLLSRISKTTLTLPFPAENISNEFKSNKFFFVLHLFTHTIRILSKYVQWQLLEQCRAGQSTSVIPRQSTTNINGI